MKKDALANRALSRRQFLKSAATVAGMAGLGPMLAACQTQPPAAPAPPAATAAPPAAPVATAAAPAAAPAATAGVAKAKRGGTLRAALSTFSSESFLMNRSPTVARAPHAILYESLVYYSPDDPFKFVPGLAESWSTTDMKHWTFKIKKGVQWDKGQGEVTAEDVAFTLRLLARQDSKGADVAYWRPRVDKMKVVDPYTLTFELDAIDEDMLTNFSPYRGTQIMCKKYIEAVGEDKADREPVGSGPYRLTKHVEGSRMEFEAVGESHWRVPPMWDKYEFEAIPEERTRFAMLETGRADIIDITPEMLKPAQDRGFLVIPSIAASSSVILFGGMVPPSHPEYKGTEPWQDVRVREAMNIAIDRDAINKTFFAGAGNFTPSPGKAVAPITATAHFGRAPYDPARAKQLLKEAGKEGFEPNIISYSYDGFPATPQVLQAVAGYWEAVGLRPKITPMDRMAFRDYWLKDKANGMLFPWTLPIGPEGQSAFEKFFYSKVLGFKIYADAHLDAAYEELAVTGDPDKRAKMLVDAQMYLLKNWVAIQVANNPLALFAADPKKVSAWKRNRTGSGQTWEYVEPKL